MNSDSVRFEVGALSETGYVREENQDKMSWSTVPLGQLYIVADGMGGHKGGAVAADIAIQELQRHIKEAPAGEAVDQVIQTAFIKANEAIYQKGNSGDRATEGMGTTAVLLLISERIAKIAHVGDSRAYLYRDGVLSRLTTDHTVVQKMVQAGMLKPEDAADHPNASVLERAIGSRQTVDVDIRNEPLKEGDAFLLCSDGLSGYVTDQEIEAVVRSHSTSQQTASCLVELALQKGGKDNVTVQFVQYGPRKEQQRVAASKLEKPASTVASPKTEPPAIASTKPETTKTTTPSKPRHGVSYIASGFALGAVIVASGSYVFMSKKIAGFEMTSAELKTSSERGNKLQSELEEAKTGRERAEKDLRQAKTVVSKLQKELAEAKTGREQAEKDVRQAKAEAAKLQKELAEAKTGKERAEKDVRQAKAEASKLQKERDEARTAKAATDKQLEEAKKQIQSLTKASNNASRSKEPEKTAGPAGTVKDSTGTESTAGQKETTEPKNN